MSTPTAPIATARTTPRIVVAGGGPAGCQAALMLAHYGRPALLVDPAAQLGGLQALSPYPNGWVLGRPGKLSQELAAEMASHLRQTPTGVALGWRLSAVAPGADRRFELTLTRADGSAQRQLEIDVLLLAMGTRFRGRAEMAEISGYQDVAHLVLHDPIEATGLNPLDAEQVLIIGGGDNAFEAAVWCCERGLAVTVAARSKVRAQAGLRERLESFRDQHQASVLEGVRLVGLSPRDGRILAMLQGQPLGYGLTVDRLMLMIGYTPALEGIAFSDGLVPARDAAGYLTIDGDGATSIPGIWAAGDLANPRHPCVTTALGAGTVAAQAIEAAFAAEGVASRA